MLLLAIWVSSFGGGFTVISNSLIPFFNLVFSFCIVFRGLKYMEEGSGVEEEVFEHSVVLAGVSASLLFFWHLGVDDGGWRR